MDTSESSSIYDTFWQEVFPYFLEFLTDVYGSGFIQTEKDLDNLESFLYEPESEFCYSFDFSPEWIDAVCSNIYPRWLPFLFSLEILFTVNSQKIQGQERTWIIPPTFFFCLTKSVFTNIS